MYLSGFGNYHQSEAIAGALPQQQNGPQHCPYGLFAEQLSGTAFTKARSSNLHSWLYKTLPSVVHLDFVPYLHEQSLLTMSITAPNPYRWSPLPLQHENIDFIDSLLPVAATSVIRTYLFHCDKRMERYFVNNDGELLIVLYKGSMTLLSEFGKLELRPGFIAVIPRGVKFRIEHNETIAGYLCENAAAPLTLPNLGVIGANGLANPRHFLYPVAWYEDRHEEVELICKSNQQFWQARYPSSPLNTIAWHGNFAPYLYDLSLFNTINTVSFDHPDPSIFTVLTSESEFPGIANLDFVIFPARWMVAEHSFRPPYFHRNIMSEFMGLIMGTYDAKKEGFLPGGFSIHNGMVAHGPDTDTYLNAIEAQLAPCKYENTLAFMFETREPWMISQQALNHPARQHNYTDCWQRLPRAYLPD